MPSPHIKLQLSFVSTKFTLQVMQITCRAEFKSQVKQEDSKQGTWQRVPIIVENESQEIHTEADVQSMQWEGQTTQVEPDK